MDRSLRNVLKACEMKIKEGSTTFYKAFGLLPSPRREAVFVLYAFCRMIDDAMDEPDQSPYTLDELSLKLQHLEQAEGHYIWPALRWLFDAFPLTKEPFWRQIEGQRLDEHLTRYETMEQFEQYCYLVAGTVGEMLLPVLHDSPDPSVIEAGIKIGKAMQIVNIIRDVGEDQTRGRRYIPLELMRAHGYTEQEFEQGLVNEAWAGIVRELSLQARQWFDEGLSQTKGYPRMSAFCVELSSRMYEAILDDVADHHSEVFRRRAYVSALAKLTILQRLMKKHGVALPGQEAKENAAV
ncbi:phytoene/squalene synthase family protein [Paenibacillus sp. 1P07SE]|uniref:phytoene/squalene synthase family protein n=1 Tax=Paenibacillus sp. 1P07SE TaxID=3132209 RepID=UPI0039A6DAFA